MHLSYGMQNTEQCLSHFYELPYHGDFGDVWGNSNSGT